MKKIIIGIFIFILVIIGITFINKDINKTKNKLTKVKVAEVAHSIFYAPQYIAVKKGYFKVKLSTSLRL